MLGPLAVIPGLIDEYLIGLHPAVIPSGPRLFENLVENLALELLDTKVFAGGCVVLRYKVRQPAGQEE
jgi:hypothetical protein